MIKPGNIIIIGGNAAGPSAAAKAKRISPESNVILFEAGDYISTGTCEMPYVVSGEISSYEKIVFFDPDKFRTEKGVEVFVRHRVEEVDRRQKLVSVRDLKTNKLLSFPYDRLILATGSKVKRLTQFPPELSNVFYLKSIRDLILIQNHLSEKKVKSAAIIGSGYIGLEMAEALSLSGIEVTLIEKEPLPFPQSEPEIQNLLKEILNQRNIQFFGDVKEIKSFQADNLVRSLIIDQRRLEFDLIFITSGITPNNQLALKNKLDLGISGALKVDRRLKTSDGSIFACGDNIEVINFVTGKADYIPIATIAHSYGHIAGENAAGGNALTDPVVKNTAFRFFDNAVVTTGLTSLEAKFYGYNFRTSHAVEPGLVKVMPGVKNSFGKVIYESNTRRILGASFLGGREVTGYGDIISALILAKTDARALSKINFNYTPPLSPFINLLSVIGRKIR